MNKADDILFTVEVNFIQTSGVRLIRTNSNENKLKVTSNFYKSFKYASQI